MRTGGENVFDWIFIFAFRALDPFASPLLSPVGADRSPFDIAPRGDRDDHIFFFDQILVKDLGQLFVGNNSTASVGVFPFNLFEILFDHVTNDLLIRQDSLVLFDLVKEFLVLSAQTILFQVDQLAKCHPEDRIGLNWRQVIHIRFTTLLFEEPEPFFA